MNNLKIFSGSSNPHLASDIAFHLKQELGNIFLHSFPSGESFCQFKENIRGCDVFLVQSITTPANDNLMQLLVMADAARRASAARITAVVPYFSYARQDRKDKSRVPISAKLVLDLFESSGIDRVLTMDLHSPQICGFTNLPFDHLTFEPVLKEHINQFWDKKNLMLMAPDVGAVKRVEQYASALKCDFGFISKKRIDDTKVELENIVGDIKDKEVLIIDDLTESCGTLLQAAEACLSRNAASVSCAVTHGCFTDVGIFRLNNAFDSKKINRFICSNTANFLSSEVNDKVTKLNVARLFATAIENIHNNKSVSELFV